MSEAALERWFAQRVRLLGGYSIKLAPTEAGIPDRLVMFPGGRFFFVELKTETGSLAPIQKHWHAKVSALGFPVHVIYGRQQATEWLSTVFNAGIRPVPRRSSKTPK